MAQADPLRHAAENLVCSHKGEFANAGHRLLMNQDTARREALVLAWLDPYAKLDELLCRYAWPGLHTHWLWPHGLGRSGLHAVAHALLVSGP